MLTQGRGVRWHLPFRPVGLALIFCLRGGGGISRHAFPLVGATPVSCNCGAAYIPLAGYAAGLVRLAAGLYVTRYAGSHHNHQGCITISNLFPFLLLTLRHRWSVYVATPFHPHLTYSIHRNSLDNHGTSQPLRWCRQSEPFIFIEPGSANNNFLRLAAFAQRTRKARLLLTCGAIHLVPPPASCPE